MSLAPLDPDTVVGCLRLPRQVAHVAATGGDTGAARRRVVGYDLILTRPLDAGRLLERFEERRPGMRT